MLDSERLLHQSLLLKFAHSGYRSSVLKTILNLDEFFQRLKSPRDSGDQVRSLLSVLQCVNLFNRLDEPRNFFVWNPLPRFFTGSSFECWLRRWRLLRPRFILSCVRIAQMLKIWVVELHAPFAYHIRLQILQTRRALLCLVIHSRNLLLRCRNTVLTGCELLKLVESRRLDCFKMMTWWLFSFYVCLKDRISLFGRLFWPDLDRSLFLPPLDLDFGYSFDLLIIAWLLDGMTAFFYTKGWTLGRMPGLILNKRFDSKALLVPGRFGWHIPFQTLLFLNEASSPASFIVI